MQISEYVTIGHPDKVADYIASYILDRYIAKDPHTRFALEVQIKDNFVTLGGEITSTAEFSDEKLATFAKEAVAEIGYTGEYAASWDNEATHADKLEVFCHIGKQSPDIAQGVDLDAWGDQGIFWGMACDQEQQMPLDIFLARAIGDSLFDSKLGGLDIKTQVTIDDGKIRKVIVAIPLKNDADTEAVKNYILANFNLSADVELIVNGTGRFFRHGSVGDCGTTGRKLAVDFYGGNCRIGGGCPWGKDGTKADVALNKYARKLAEEYQKEHNTPLVYVAIACCIGKREIDICYFDAQNKLLEQRTEARPASMIIQELGLDKPNFAKRCKEGQFND